ncbi:DUF2313 domain-containing protein [Limnobaculum zhutongyuii]|uniref:DUF2313 domain-containing protein n=1 Tax=Limnobaculum zhutongyuii TaxID=2498113 RepID=A0A411WII8_9GAMM|nr:YmfQ family protein [Limnobaculum zhutongyuii]QBH96001.1 DUF2313 domain-containing protein [Limnobaculum zhutongyuii]TQS89288.1 DUF2313 domain-containing protein [Limnobaculum zhutongyuii]
MRTSNLLKTLLPPVSYEPNGERLSVEINAQSAVLDAVEQSAQQVADAVTPFLSGSLIADWERVYAVPVRAGATYQERLSNVLAKMAETGGVSIPYFIQLAATMGYTITIDELQPFRTGINRCGDMLYTADIIWVWRVNIMNAKTPIYQFRVGVSTAGERLLTFGDDIIETVFNDLKPAETLCVFAYHDLSPIDLTTPGLDPRVIYQCDSEHACYGQDGKIYYAAPNEWPVEYQNGTLIGRHEPEPESINLIELSNGVGSGGWQVFNSAAYDPKYTVEVIHGDTPAGIDDYVRVTMVIRDTNDPSPTVARCGIESGGVTGHLSCSYFYKNGISDQLRNQINDIDTTDIPLSTEWIRYVSSINYTSGDYRFIDLPSQPGLSGVFDAWNVQINIGSATSPIKTTGIIKKRTQANVFIPTTGATGCQILYSNGEYDEYSFSEGEFFQLPHSTRDWGVRYAQKIVYITNW